MGWNLLFIGSKNGFAMPFHFKKSEPLAKVVRRIFAERVDAACDRLDEAHRPKAIHQVRKEIKKLRAVLELVRAELAPEEYRKIRKCLRRAAQLLALVRDARVRFLALDKIVKNPKARFPIMRRRLHENWRREVKRLRTRQATSAVDRHLHKAERKMRRAKIKALDLHGLADVFRCDHEHGREQFLQASREPLPENFHSWRKLVKTHWYQLRLLPPPRPHALRRMIDDFETLGGFLGEEHDLHLLAEFVAENARGADAEIQVLKQVIAVRRQKLRAAAFKLGARLYAGESSAWMRKYGLVDELIS